MATPGCSKQEQYERVNKKTIEDVDQKIDEVIAENVKPAETVVQCKSEIPNISRPGKTDETSQISNWRIIDNITEIIDLKRNRERIRIDEKRQKR